MDPAWECLASRVQNNPTGPKSTGRPWRALVIGFGRGFEVIALLRRVARDAPGSRWEITGLEPNPDWLEPWPPRWIGLQPEEAPWWGMPGTDWTLAHGSVQLRIEPVRAAAWLAAAPAQSLDLVLLDLFSPARPAEDWEQSLAEGLAHAAGIEAVLTGYSCARSVRESLAGAGWSVERLRRRGLRDSLRAVWMSNRTA